MTKDENNDRLERNIAGDRDREMRGYNVKEVESKEIDFRVQGVVLRGKKLS